MSNQFHLFLEDAFRAASPEPGGSYYEMSLMGDTERQLHSIRQVLDQAKARGFIVTVYTNAETMRSCGLHGETEIGGCPIIVGSTEQTTYVKFKFSRPVGRR